MHGQANRLKNLTNYDMLVGNVVEDQLELALEALRDGKEPPNNLTSRAESALTRRVESSQNAVARLRDGKRLYGSPRILHSHYYGLDDEAELEKAYAKIKRAMFGLEASKLFETLRKVPVANWKPARQPYEYNSVQWELDGIPVSCSIDFWIAYPSRFYIFDWKSGSYVSNEEALQIATYSLWAQAVKGYSQDQVRVQVLHLPDGQEAKPKVVSELFLETAKVTILDEFYRERSMLTEVVQADGQIRYHADEEQFPVSPSEACKTCKFLEVCTPGRIASKIEINAPAAYEPSAGRRPSETSK